MRKINLTIVCLLLSGHVGATVLHHENRDIVGSVVSSGGKDEDTHVSKCRKRWVS